MRKPSQAFIDFHIKTVQARACLSEMKQHLASWRAFKKRHSSASRLTKEKLTRPRCGRVAGAGAGSACRRRRQNIPAATPKGFIQGGSAARPVEN